MSIYFNSYDAAYKTPFGAVPAGQEVTLHLTVPEGDVFLADENPAALADLFIVSKVELTVGGELAVKVENAAGTKCPRCWKHSLTPNAEGLCPRCAEVVRHLPDLL